MPRMIDLIRASAVPSTLMQSAAKGALSVPPQEMIEILVHLAEHNRVCGDQARLTLAGWDERLAKDAASDPNSPKEVLAYLASPKNLRPVLLSALLENPAVPEESLSELAASGSGEVVEAMLKSPRAGASVRILEGLDLNPALTGIDSVSVKEKLATVRPEKTPATTPPEGGTPTASADDPSGLADVLDEGLNSYLADHADEILADQDKEFQPIGGFYEDFIPGADEPLAEPPAAPAGQAQAAAAPAPAKTVKKGPPNPNEQRGSALQKISRLDIKGRIQLAMKGTKEERSLLIRDGTKVVALAVLESPKIGDAEVERFASQKNVLEAVLRTIPLKRRFMKHYGIVRNLVFNPRTPLDVSLGLMKNILVNDLRNLSGNKEVSETVRKLALKMFKMKIASGRKE